MGLLLGASVITIFEFLDLLFYNAIAKCCRRRYKTLDRRRNTEIARLTRLDQRPYQSTKESDVNGGGDKYEMKPDLYNGNNV